MQDLTAFSFSLFLFQHFQRFILSIDALLTIHAHANSTKLCDLDSLIFDGESATPKLKDLI